MFYNCNVYDENDFYPFFHTFAKVRKPCVIIMEKEALITMLLNDIKEMELLISTFKGKSTIPASYFKLAKSKLNNINDELSMVEDLFNSPIQTDNTVKTNYKIQEPEIQPSKTASENLPETTNISSTEDLLVIDNHQPIIKVDEQPIVKASSTDKQDLLEIEEVKNPVEIKNPAETKTAATEVISKKVEPELPPVVTPKPEPVKAAPAATSHPVTPKTNGNGDNKILGEKIAADQKSLNDTIVKTSANDDIAQYGAPVSDIKKALGINDRFYFQRELFENNNTLFNNVLDQINTLTSYNEAYLFLKSNFNWDETAKETEEFLRIVRRRFL